MKINGNSTSNTVEDKTPFSGDSETTGIDTSIQNDYSQDNNWVNLDEVVL